MSDEDWVRAARSGQQAYARAVAAIVDKPKPAAAGGEHRRGYNIFGDMKCLVCGAHGLASIVGICPGAPKPATPDAPEWKIAPLPQPILELAEMERIARLQACGITDLMRGVSAPAPAPLDLSGCTQQATADFTARRKAKRAAPYPTEHDWPVDSGLLFSKRLCRKCGLNGADIRSATVCDGPKAAKPSPSIARALSTPLPHDPPMIVRLMPWRGK